MKGLYRCIYRLTLKKGTLSWLASPNQVFKERSEVREKEQQNVAVVLKEANGFAVWRT